VRDAHALFVDLDVADAGADAVNADICATDAADVAAAVAVRTAGGYKRPLPARSASLPARPDAPAALAAVVVARPPPKPFASKPAALNEIVLRQMGPGATFGELALLRSERRSATVRATARTELLSLDKTSYLRLMEAAMRAIELTRGGGAVGGITGGGAMSVEHIRASLAQPSQVRPSS